ncbi:MAG: hypothetical protein ACR2PT_09125 [Endozoicomonas sp.]
MLLPSMVRQGQFLVLIAATLVAGMAASHSQVETGAGTKAAGHPCDRTGQDSFVREKCHALRGGSFDEVTTVDGRKSLQQVAEDAGKKSLILADPRSGPIPADRAIARAGQLMAGLEIDGRRAVLQYTGLAGSPYMLASSSEYALTGFELKGRVARSSAPLLLALNPSRVFVAHNRFVPGKHRGGKGIRWTGLCQPGRGGEGNIMMDNEFQTGIAKTAVSIDCQDGEGRDLTSYGNIYHLSSRSVGVSIKSGVVMFNNEQFEYTGRPDDSATGIQILASEGGHPVKITVAGNTFRNLRQGIRFSGNEEVQAGSVCNKWINDADSSRSGNEAALRCQGYPRSGFVHFTDGVVCTDEWGTPADIDEIDCELASAGSSAYAPELGGARLKRSYIVTPEDSESYDHGKQRNSTSNWSATDYLTRVVTPIGIVFYYGVGVASRIAYAGASNPATIDKAMVASWLFSTGFFFVYDLLKVLYQASTSGSYGSYQNPYNILLALYEGLFYSFPGDDYSKKYIPTEPATTAPAIVPADVSPPGSLVSGYSLPVPE